MSAYIPKVVMITGCTGGFGTAFAQKFAQNGSRLILTSRSEKRLHDLQKTLKDPVVYPIISDIRETDEIKRALDTRPPEFDAIDLLINNAGLALGFSKAYEAKLEDWEDMININTKGLVACTRLVLPGMVERERGHIINIGSTAGNYPYPMGHVYCGTKAFVKQFSLALRADLTGTGVRVTNIEPGKAKTNFSVVRFKGNLEKAEEVYEGMEPLTAEDVAEAVFWAATLPLHVNVNRLELMPTNQSFGPFAIHRDPS